MLLSGTLAEFVRTVLTVHYPLRCEEHHACQGTREDDVLARVQVRQRRGNLECRFLVRLQMFVILSNLVLLVVEVLFIASETWPRDCSEERALTAS